MLNKACPICGGDVYSEGVEYGVMEYRCLQAGHLVPEEYVNKLLVERGLIENKEVTMEFKGLSKHQKGQYIKEHLDEIVEDIQTMKDDAVMAKWGFKNSTCYELRKKHAPETIGKRRVKKPRVIKESKALSEKPIEGTSPLTEHERYLMLLGYQQATREFLQSLKNTFKK